MKNKIITLEDFIEKIKQKNITVNYKGEKDWIKRKIFFPHIEFISGPLNDIWDNFQNNLIVYCHYRDFLLFNNLSKKKKKRIIKDLSEKKVSAVLIKKNIISKTLSNMFMDYKIPIICIDLPEDEVLYNSINVLQDLMGEKKTISGVLVDVAEQGVLIIGKSGIGKSESALELIRKNHSLVSDDVVLVQRIGNQIYGKSPDVSDNYLEIRGVGIINIKEFFGLRAIVDRKKIDLVVNLVMFDKSKHFQRLGIDKEKFKILDIELPMYTIPVTPGKSISTIIELIAKNEYIAKKGYSSSKKITNSLIKKIKKKNEEK